MSTSAKTQPPSDAADQLHVTVEPLASPHEGVSVVSLQRVDARNAVGRQLLRELTEVGQ